MIDSRIVLRLLRVPPEPQPPAGASLRVFRAAPNFYRLRLLQWGGRQLSALAGIIAAIVGLHVFRNDVAPKMELDGLATGLLLLEALGILGFLVQIPFTFLATRFDYQLRWYLVTDRSLRIRSGIWTVEELTMTYANIQELTVCQGPVHRLLGLAVLRVRSAGGGSGGQQGHSSTESHVASFHGVDNAEEIRDLILSHLRRLKDTGLGDPDAVQTEPGSSPPDSAGNGELVEAATELLTEARALRAHLRPAPGGLRPKMPHPAWPDAESQNDPNSGPSSP